MAASVLATTDRIARDACGPVPNRSVEDLAAARTAALQLEVANALWCAGRLPPATLIERDGGGPVPFTADWPARLDSLLLRLPNGDEAVLIEPLSEDVVAVFLRE